MGRQLTSEQKVVIEALHKKGLSAMSISKRIGCSHVTVIKLLKKISLIGSSKRKSGTGKKNIKTTCREDRLIKKLCSAKRTKSAEEINSEFYETTNTKVSNRTVNRRLYSLGLFARRPRKKSGSTPKMRTARVNFVKDHLHWTENDWKAVIFTDETKCNLKSSDGIQYVRQRTGEELKKECVLTRNKFPVSFMLWGCILYFGQGELAFCTGSINGDSYIKIISDHLVSSIESLIPVVVSPIFQDDSAACHRAKKGRFAIF